MFLSTACSVPAGLPCTHVLLDEPHGKGAQPPWLMLHEMLVKHAFQHEVFADDDGIGLWRQCQGSLGGTHGTPWEAAIAPEAEGYASAKMRHAKKGMSNPHKQILRKSHVHNSGGMIFPLTAEAAPCAVISFLKKDAVPQMAAAGRVNGHSSTSRATTKLRLLDTLWNSSMFHQSGESLPATDPYPQQDELGDTVTQFAVQETVLPLEDIAAQEAVIAPPPECVIDDPPHYSPEGEVCQATSRGILRLCCPSLSNAAACDYAASSSWFVWDDCQQINPDEEHAPQLSSSSDDFPARSADDPHVDPRDRILSGDVLSCALFTIDFDHHEKDDFVSPLHFFLGTEEDMMMTHLSPHGDETPHAESEQMSEDALFEFFCALDAISHNLHT